MIYSKRKIYRILQKDARCNPFNPKYDRQYVVELIDSLMQSISIETEDKILLEVDEVADTCYSTIFFNSIFSNTYEVLKDFRSEISLSIKDVFSMFISILNREYILIQRNSMEQIISRDKDKNYSFLQSSSVKIDTGTAAGFINSQGAAESSVDTTNVLLNYFRYLDDKVVSKNSLSELEIIDSFRHSFMVSSFFITIKQSYEDAIWNEGFVKVDDDRKEIKIDFDSHRNLKLLKAGHTMMNQTIFGRHYSYKESSQYFKASQFSTKSRKYKRIKKLGIENGYVRIWLADGIDRNEEEKDALSALEVSAFYEFLKDISFTNYPELNIDKMMTMFNVFSYLVHRLIVDLPITDDSILNLSDSNKFPYRIRKEELKKYLNQKTNYSNKEIRSFLSILTSDLNRFINLWERPLIDFGDDFLFPLLPIQLPVKYNLIDTWFELGGVSLDSRGKHFESYLKERLSAIIQKRRYNVNVFQQNTFKNNNDEKEEIDLLISLNDVLLVCEVKCIKYPMEVRDYHNSHERLRKGCNQIVRKADFLSANSKCFKPILGELSNKRILKLVITNYPQFSGYNYMDVPIVDSHLFLHYFNTGRMTTYAASKKEGHVFNDIVNEIKFYRNEQELIENLESFFKSPIPINKILNEIEIVKTEITIGDIGYKIYTNSAELKEII